MKYKLEDIYVIVVLYNINYEHSLSLKKFLSIKDINICVCDNSTDDYGNAELSKYANVNYINMGGNKGLSRAYNRAVSSIKKNKLIILFDDDTDIPDNYFEMVLEKVSAENSDIYIPIVLDDTGIISPCRNKHNCFFRYNTIEDIDDKFSAINSGLIIKSDVFINYRYDENLFLDYIDHDFILNMKKRGATFNIFKELILKQSFSLTTDSKTSAIRRLKILKKDIKYFYRNQKRYYYWTLFKKKIHLCLIYKSLCFILI